MNQSSDIWKFKSKACYRFIAPSCWCGSWALVFIHWCLVVFHLICCDCVFGQDFAQVWCWFVLWCFCGFHPERRSFITNLWSFMIFACVFFGALIYADCLCLFLENYFVFCDFFTGVWAWFSANYVFDTLMLQTLDAQESRKDLQKISSVTMALHGYSIAAFFWADSQPHNGRQPQQIEREHVSIWDCLAELVCVFFNCLCLGSANSFTIRTLSRTITCVAVHHSDLGSS